MPSFGMGRRVDILLTDVSEERIASIFKVYEIHERQLPAHVGSSVVDFIYREDGDDTFLRNVG
jgi:hypothetical protein